MSTSATGSTSASADVEPHPRLHDWDKLPPRDYVLAWTTRKINGVRTRVPTHVKRVERCPHCPIEHVLHIHVATWEYFKRPYYRGRRRGERIVRVSRAEWTRRRFLERTDLEPEVVEQLR